MTKEILRQIEDILTADGVSKKKPAFTAKQRETIYKVAKRLRDKTSLTFTTRQRETLHNFAQLVRVKSEKSGRKRREMTTAKLFQIVRSDGSMTEDDTCEMEFVITCGVSFDDILDAMEAQWRSDSDQ